jgi:hypothetical protein
MRILKIYLLKRITKKLNFRSLLNYIRFQNNLLVKTTWDVPINGNKSTSIFPSSSLTSSHREHLKLK